MTKLQSSFLALARWPSVLSVISLFLLTACNTNRSSFLDPGGPIAAAQKAHMIEVVAWTMVAIVPVFVLVPLMLWRYRYRNTKARYTPDWEFSRLLDLLMWGVPLIIITVLSVALWKSTHDLDPYRPIASDQPPINVQVVGLDWKWLFIYPDYGIATVNELAFPVGASLALDLTSDTVMQSFMVSALAGQIYVMPGMRTQLHLLADEIGNFEGENTQFTGIGFTEQKFEALSMTFEDFTAWVARVRSQGVPLDVPTYARLGASSTGVEARATLGTAQMPAGVIYFSSVEPSLFFEVMGRYMGGTAVPSTQQPGAVGYELPAAQTGDSQ